MSDPGKKDDDKNIVIKFTIYPLLMIVIYGSVTIWFLSKFTKINLFMLTAYFIIGLILFSMPFVKVMLQIKKRIKAGENIKVSGNKFSLKNPLMIEIPKKPKM